MNDYAALAEALTMSKGNIYLFRLVLSRLQQPRQDAYVAAHGAKNNTCDCLFYQPGDWAAALAEVKANPAGV